MSSADGSKVNGNSLNIPMNTMRGQTLRVGGVEPKQRNAHKLLGMRTQDISTNLFAQQQGQGANMVTGGKIVRSEFFGFWSQLANSEQTDAKDFFNIVINQLKEFDRQHAVATANNHHNLHINGITPNTIYNTIAFLLCNTSVKIDREKLALVYNAYADASRDNVRIFDSTTHKNIMRLVTTFSSGESTDESVLSPLIIAASSITPKDVRFHDWLRLPTVDEADIQSNEFGFVYNFLFSLVDQFNYQVLHPLIKAVYDKAHSLPQQARMSLPVAEQTLLCLCHIMRNILTTHALPNIDFLERGIRIFRQFSLWQQPFGKISEQLVNLLKQEMLNPGFNRRQQILSEALVVDYGASGASANQFYKFSKPIFYLYDMADTSALPLLNIIDPTPFSQACVHNPLMTMSLQDQTSGGQYPPPGILAQNIVHAFEWISPETQFKPEECDKIRHLSADKLSHYTQRLTMLETKYKQESDTFCYNVMDREQDYLNMKRSMLKEAANTASAPPVFQFPHDNAQLPSPLPPIEHVRVPVELKQASKQTGSAEHHALTGYPAQGMYEKMRTLFEQYQQHPAHLPPSPPGIPTKSREVRLCVIGNDRLLQQVVTSYYLLASHAPHVLDGLDVKFYVVPCTKNHFAGYLARHDLWYMRHIFTPFRCPYPFVAPWIRDDETEVKLNNEGQHLALTTQFYRNTVEQYVREARHTYKATIFKVEGWLDSTSDPEIIPFLQRLELGITPALEEFRLKSGQAALKYEEIMKDKTFVYTPPELTIKYSKVDLIGQPKPEIVDDAIPYQSIVLSHVPRKNDYCNVPEPHSTGIELFVQPGAKIEKNRLRKNSLFFDPRQHIAEVTCTSQSPFKIVADGGVYGPFKTIRVSVATSKADGKIAHFPVQAFFPKN